MGMIDRTIRLLAALAILVFFAMGTISGVAVVVLGLLAAVLLVTSLAGVCPAYVPFGFSTRRGRDRMAPRRRP
ncbi:MAG: DUF2892 domain-containing protein [Chitinivibrionales bacterium]|nr:DUF2892 domain-containing protein [Chitinivibrionales bacterium]MBD3395289.1 DUF2892 domain-containing protein [Chitinivibrionales bacterium]